MKSKILLFCCLLFEPVGILADELNDRQQLIEKHLLLEAMELNSKTMVRAVKSVSKTCLTAPLPNMPKTPNYSKTFVDYSGDAVALTFWREPCADGVGSALLVRASPKQNNPFICSASFKIIQDGIQLNDIKLQSTPTSNSWCDDLFVDTTLIINQYEFGEVQFNPAKALVVAYEDITLEIPVGGLPKPSINGSVIGYKNYSITCKNIKKGTVKTFPLQTNTAWNCNGLVIKSGDTVQATIKGVAK